jgi:putative ABC transport system substrate-binding protein
MTTSPGDPVGQRLVEAFHQGLRELGWVEGQNIAMESRYAEGRYERLPALAAELVRLKPDVIVAGITAAALAAKNVTRTIPIVVGVSLDPVGSGLVASLARPGGNVTGLSLMGVEITAKQMELLKEAVPKVSRVAVLRYPGAPPSTHPTHPAMVKEAERAARLLGIQLQVLAARGPEDFDSAFSAMARERAEALLVLPDAMFTLQRTRLAELAAKHRLPAMYGLKEHAEAGGLIAYGADLRYNYRRAAAYVDKILKGAKPADLPVEQPMKFELVINMKTAKALGLTIPPSVLVRADHVIE